MRRRDLLAGTVGLALASSRVAAAQEPIGPPVPAWLRRGRRWADNLPPDAGPATGEIPHLPRGTEIHRLRTTLTERRFAARDFVLRVMMSPGRDSDGAPWDIGSVFRRGGGPDYRAVWITVDDAGAWALWQGRWILTLTYGEVIAQGTFPSPPVLTDGALAVELVVVGAKAGLTIAGADPVVVELPEDGVIGHVGIGAAIAVVDRSVGAVTRYRDYRLWSLD
jgi:hypothetical protein